MSSLAPSIATSAAEATPATQPAIALAGATTSARDSADDRTELAEVRREQARAALQARQEAETRAAAAQAQARQEAEAAAERSSRSAPRAAPAPAPAPAPDGSVQTVIAFAKAQIGEPYVYGAAGPDSWDCSGLTMRAYEQIGVHLGHYTGSQMGAGRRVSRGELTPGDLVFPDEGHVGLYIGGNQIVHAPQPGDHVKVSTIWSFYTAVRLV